MYDVKFVVDSEAANLAGLMRRIIIAGKLAATIVLPNGSLSDGTRSTIATAKRAAKRNGQYHPASDRVWEVLDTDGKTVIGTFEVPVGKVAAVIGASFIRQYREPVGSDSAGIDDLADELFGGSFDDLPDAPETSPEAAQDSPEASEDADA
jgi:hypothetical protein